MLDNAILDCFKNKNVLITGGTGLIGRQLVCKMCDADAHVVSVSLDSIHIDDRASHIFGDLSDFNFCKEITTDMDYVFHVAGIKGSIEVTKSCPASFFVPLLMMNTNMLEASRINKVGKVLYTSSIGAYKSADVFKEGDVDDGLPMDAYPGLAKRVAEKQIVSYKTQYGLDNFSIVRPCNVYGPGDNFDPENAMVIPSLMYRIKSGEDPVMIWGDGSAIRDFAFSGDVADGIILAIMRGTSSPIAPFINLGSGTGYSIKTLVETLNMFLEFNYEFDTTKSSGFPKRVMDISLAKSMGYSPSTSLLDGLKITWEWFSNHQNEYLNRKNYFLDRD